MAPEAGRLPLELEHHVHMLAVDCRSGQPDDAAREAALRESSIAGGGGYRHNGAVKPGSKILSQLLEIAPDAFV